MRVKWRATLSAVWQTRFDPEGGMRGTWGLVMFRAGVGLFVLALLAAVVYLTRGGF